MSRVLVTGGGGFVGKRLVKRLTEDGFLVKILSREIQLHHETVICDLQSDIIPDSALEGVDTVFHLAGFAHDIRDEKEVEDLYYRVNVDATVQLANLAVKSNVKKFVFVSSVKAGGVLDSRNCVDESEKGKSEGVYGETKRQAELALLKVYKESNMHVSIIRPSLVYGPNIKGNLKSMLLGIKQGWFPPLPETGNRRSMIHVDDLVRAILLIAKDKRANGEIFIATDGTPYSSREIYDAMCSVAGKSIPKWSMPKFLFDVAGILSPRIKYKLNKLLGNECYSSAKLEALGFKAKKSLKGMNETDF
jgi:nucleoside-diphosphate-sugar epimerase